MRIRILMTGDDLQYLKPEVDMLKERGFMVYTCEEANVEGMVGEIKPDLVYINPKNPGANSTHVYHSLLDNVLYASLPVIYTLSEDDVYLVNKSRTISRDKRNIITDNVIDGIKTALHADVAVKRRKRVNMNTIPFHYHASRA